MGDKVGILPSCDLDQLAGDAGSCQRGAQQVPVLINGIGLNRGPNEVLHKLGTQIFNENLHRNRGQDQEHDFVFCVRNTELKNDDCWPKKGLTL